MQLNFVKVFFSKTKEGTAVYLGIAAYPVADPRVNILAVVVSPYFLGLVAAISKNGVCAPVCFLFG